MIESLLVPLAGQLPGHLGKRAIDHFWRERSTATTIDAGYEIAVPPADYFIRVLVVDQRAPDLFRAGIQAYGLPRTIEQLVNGPGQVVCPRCAGSGFVGWADITRLGAAGLDVGGWRPGPCLLCAGHGVVAADFALYRSIGN